VPQRLPEDTGSEYRTRGTQAGCIRRRGTRQSLTLTWCLGGSVRGPRRARIRGPTTDPSHPTSHSNPRRKSPWFPISPHHSLFVQRLCVAPGGRVLLRTIEVQGVGVPGIVNWGSHGVRFGNPCEGARAWRRTGSEDGTRGTRGNLSTEGNRVSGPLPTCGLTDRHSLPAANRYRLPLFSLGTPPFPPAR
jgi:hypothetical protein